MPKSEINRKIVDGKVIVVYDDGSEKVVEVPKPVASLVVDAEDSSNINTGHTIKEQ